MAVSFNSIGDGSFDRNDTQKAFGAVDWTRTERTRIVSEGGNKFLRVEFPKGGVGPNEGGAQFMTDFTRSIGAHDELYLSYRVRVAPGFDWVKGGKLPGLSGGNANSGGSKPNGHDGFSARMMWKGDGSAIQYVYHPDQPSRYGDGMQWNGGALPKGQWVTVETRVKLNTPGERNGVVQGWMNGRKVLDRSGVRFRDTNNLKIDGLFFSTFFGGADSSWAPTKNEHIDFDDFVISKSPITH